MAMIAERLRILYTHDGDTVTGLHQTPWRYRANPP